MRSISRIAVSGATSFLGSAVVKKLIEKDCEVFGIVRPTSQARALLPENSHFHEILCDISETDIWMKEIDLADSFLHFAWGGPGIQGRSDPIVQKQSADNTIQAMYAAEKLGVTRFFISGSQAEYGQTHGKITEDTPCNPVLEYGKNKLKVCQEAPQIANSLGMEYIHARFFSVYGPNDHPYTLIPSCIRTFLRGETMELSECKNMWNFLHVEDAAEAVLALMECELPESSLVINVASPESRILREYVEEIHSLCCNKGQCAFGTRHISETPVDNWPDISKLLRTINWLPRVSFSEGISNLIKEELSRME